MYIYDQVLSYIYNKPYLHSSSFICILISFQVAVRLCKCSFQRETKCHENILNKCFGNFILYQMIVGIDTKSQCTYKDSLIVGLAVILRWSHYTVNRFYCTGLLYLFTVPVYCTCLLYLFTVPVYCTCLLYLFIVPVYCTCLLYLFTVSLSLHFNLFCEEQLFCEICEETIAKSCNSHSCLS